MNSSDLAKPLAATRGTGVAPSLARGRAGARQVLEGCWAPAWQILSGQMTAVIGQSIGPAATNMDHALNKPAKRLLADAGMVVGLYERALRAEFRKALDDFIERRAEDKPVAAAAHGLSLVDYGAMELSTLVEAAAARALNAVDDHYASLKRRIAGLVHEAEIREPESPFRPVLFFRALHQALENSDILSDRELVECLPSFDGPMVKPMVAVYAELDSHLKGRGYSADLPQMAVARNTTMRGRMTQTGWGARATQMSGGGMTSAGAELLLSSLYRRMNLGAMPPGGLPLAPIPSEGAPLVGAVGGEAGAALPLPPVAAGLLFGGGIPFAGAEADAGGAPHVVPVDLLSAIAEIQKLGAMALSAVQQGQPAPDASVDNAQLRGKLIDKANDQVDKLTIEIVGLLFERIDQDRHVPQPIKEALRRLQFPMTKVALTDPDLFVSPDQAARTLIDRIASTAIGWTSEGQDNQRYLAEVQRAVHTVLSSGDAGLAPFEQALEVFERYLNEERTRDDDPVARAKKALAEAENREVMAINTMIQVRALFDGLQIESYLREFLLETWVRVMVASHMRSPDDPQAVQKYMVIVPDLVWSVQPKFSPEERKRLVSTIPPVLSVLREGLALIEWPPQSMQEFFGRLMNSHAEAVKALELAHVRAAAPVQPAADTTIKSRMQSINLDRLADPPPRGDTPTRLNEHIVKQVLAANDVDVNLVSRPAAQDGGIDLLGDEGVEDMIAAFRCGDWFDLRLGDVTERVRLRWVSPQRTLFLFTPAEGRRAHSLGPDVLREYLRRRQLQPAVAEPLFERAVRGMVHELEQSASVA